MDVPLPYLFPAVKTKCCDETGWFTRSNSCQKPNELCAQSGSRKLLRISRDRETIFVSIHTPIRIAYLPNGGTQVYTAILFALSDILFSRRHYLLFFFFLRHPAIITITYIYSKKRFRRRRPRQGRARSLKQPTRAFPGENVLGRSRLPSGPPKNKTDITDRCTK